MYRKILILMVTSIIIVPSIHALSLRVHTPVSVSATCPDSSGKTLTCSPKSSGYALRGIFGLFGLGYASSSLDLVPTDSSLGYDTWKVSANAVDLSLSFLDALFTVGAGTVLGGSYEIEHTSRETTGDYYVNWRRSLTDAKLSGSTTFLNFGFGIGPMELIVGYRMWSVSTEANLTTIQTTNLPAEYGYSNSTSTATADIGTANWSEVTAGIGFGF